LPPVFSFSPRHSEQSEKSLYLLCRCPSLTPKSPFRAVSTQKIPVKAQKT
jgi:hypothetical protein